jgi:hypothetical protein
MAAIEEPPFQSAAPLPSDLLLQWEALHTRSTKSQYQIHSSLDHIEVDRTKLCEWAYLLVDHYNIERSIVGIAFSMFDRYVGAHRDGETNLELLALSCVYTAIKVHSCSGKLSSSMLVKLARSSGGERRFAVEQLEEMEFSICQRLGWHVNPPTLSMFLDVAFDFVQESAEGLHLNLMDAMKDLAVFLVEISVIDVYFASLPPSSVAMAAVLVAMEELSASESTRSLLNFFQQDRQVTRQCAHRLSRHYQNWKAGEEDKRPNRLQSASPTGVGLLENVSPPKGEGSRLQEAFDEVVEDSASETSADEQGKRGGGKRKRSSC